jgi:hypothetical protein
MRDQLDEFILGQAICKRALKMKGQLLGTVQCNQGRDGYEAPIALGKSGAFPNIAK